MGMHPKTHLIDKYTIFYDLLFKNDHESCIDFLINSKLISHEQRINWVNYFDDLINSKNLKTNLKDYFYLNLHNGIENESYLSSKKAYGIINNLYNCANSFGIDIVNHENIKKCSIIDYGAGIFRTLNQAVILYCNGFNKSYAYEPYALKTDFVVRSLFHMIELMQSNPANYIFTNISINEFIKRLNLILSFDFIDKISTYNISEIKFLNINNSIFLTNDLSHITDNSVDFHFSNAVLEHIFDFNLELSKLKKIIKSNSFGFHIVDFLDHRYYYNNSLSPMEKYFDGELFEINGLTPSQLESQIASNGFSIAKIQALKIPDFYITNEKRKLIDSYSNFNIDELREHVNWYLLSN
jgi:hypothetical protein